MFNKKYIVFYLILLFLIARLYLLFAGLENLLTTAIAHTELLRSTTTKLYMDGYINSLLDFQPIDHNGIFTLESTAIIPFFYVFGPYLFSVKLVALTFLLATMALWFFFVRRHIGAGTAVVTALLFIFAPPSFTAYNFNLGYHSVPLFFDILALTLFFEMIRNKTRLIWYILFGIVSGFALWVDNMFVITLITCMVFWFIHDKLLFLKKTFAIFVISFFTGFSIWFYYVICIRHFQIIDFFSYSSQFQKPIFYKKFFETLAYKLPYSFCFKDCLFSGISLNYFYYAIFVMAFLGLIWFQRKPILEMLFSFIPGGRQRTHQKDGGSSTLCSLSQRGKTSLSTFPGNAVAQCDQSITVESFFLGYVVIFILTFSLSRFDVSLSPHWAGYRFFTPLYPFIFVIIAIGLDKLFNIRKISFKLISCFLVFILISAGIVGLVSQTNIRDFGKGLTLKGYSYKALLDIASLSLRPDLFSKMMKVANQIDKGLYKNHIYQWYGFKVAYYDKLELDAGKAIIYNIEQTFRPNFSEGFGSGYAVVHGNAPNILEKLKSVNLTNKDYEKYLLYGIAELFPVQENVDKHISIISQIDPQYQPYFYQGMGRWLARKNRGKDLADINKTLLKIDKTNNKYCCIGIGKYFGRRLEWAFADKKYYIGFDLSEDSVQLPSRWAFADKKYYIGFDGLNNDYLPDCYYGLGWGIGDFFEFDIDRYLAVIKNNVSPEYMEHCFKGLADRLRWKFGDDIEKFQKVTELFPEPYKTQNREHT